MNDVSKFQINNAVAPFMVHKKFNEDG